MGKNNRYLKKANLLGLKLYEKGLYIMLCQIEDQGAGLFYNYFTYNFYGEKLETAPLGVAVAAGREILLYCNVLAPELLCSTCFYYYYISAHPPHSMAAC